ncbi:MAG: hypothetical protein IIA83_03940 [Thaumarchaeota archaeon]|nr:hypothetical protein [Nitrososphaerota archaeon]
MADGSMLINGLFLSFFGVVLVIWPYFSREYWDRLHMKAGVHTIEGIKRMDTARWISTIIGFIFLSVGFLAQIYAIV